MARARTSGAGWEILWKLRGPRPHPAQEASMTGTANVATKRPILTLLFHEQQTGERHPGPAVVTGLRRVSSRLAANFRQSQPKRQPQSALVGDWRTGAKNPELPACKRSR